MPENPDMAHLATRDELQLAIAPLATRDELQLAIAPLATRDELQLAIAPLATRDELQLAIAPLATRDELRLATLATRDELRLATLATRDEIRLARDEIRVLEHRIDAKFDVWLGAILAKIDERDVRMYAELARHTHAIEEGLTGRVAVVDEKYADLPARVTALEDAVPGSRR